MRNVTHIVIHCAATPNGKHIGIETIDQWHQQRGFKRSEHGKSLLNPHLNSVGYHYVIMIDGTVEQGRDLEEIGAHVQGSNARSVGICMIGTDKFTPEQWHALYELRKTMRTLFPEARFCGHRDFSPDKDGDGIVEPWEWTKTCPGFDVAEWFEIGEPREENIFRG